jgi:hypothetical protein
MLLTDKSAMIYVEGVRWEDIGARGLGTFGTGAFLSPTSYRASRVVR